MKRIFGSLALAALLVAGLAFAVPGGKGESTDRAFPRQETAQANPGQKPAEQEASDQEGDTVRCANLIYAGTKTSVCFSDRFLERVERETNIDTNNKFAQIKLATDDIYQHPFAIMTGEGSFTLLEQERKNLRNYLTRGGFLLASAGCSSREWDRSFRNEVKRIFPDIQLKKIPLDHPIYHTVFDIRDIRLSHGGRSLLEGLEYEGKIVLIYSPEGLNDTPNVKGCCCCGGNEVQNCQEVNVNILVYALTH